MYARFIFASGVLLLSAAACAVHHSQVIPAGPQGGSLGALQRSAASSTVRQPIALVQNVFQAARGNASLTDTDLDKYIDWSVTGQDRIMARKLMRFMPVRMRGDFIYVTSDHRLLTNNPAMLSYVTFTNRTSPTQGLPSSLLATSAKRALLSTRSLKDFNPPCSVPNTVSNPMGVYARYPSACGFNAGWAFVTIPSNSATDYSPGGANEMDWDGYTNSAGQAMNDQAYVYFELRGGSGNTLEGGFLYTDDNSIAAYAKTSTSSQFEAVNNGSVRFFADEQLFTMTGVTNLQFGRPPLAYMLSGAAVNVDPKSYWLSGLVLIPSPQAWTFFDAPTDFGQQAGTDAANHSSPCMVCSASIVVSIAQPNQTQFVRDGSRFGVTLEVVHPIFGTTS